MGALTRREQLWVGRTFRNLGPQNQTEFFPRGKGCLVLEDVGGEGGKAEWQRSWGPAVVQRACASGAGTRMKSPLGAGDLEACWCRHTAHPPRPALGPGLGLGIHSPEGGKHLGPKAAGLAPV